MSTLVDKFTSNTETKPGVYTTEFWTTVFINALGLVELTTGAVNTQNEYVIIALAVINGLYSASRGIAKKEQPFVPEVFEIEQEGFDPVDESVLAGDPDRV